MLLVREHNTDTVCNIHEANNKKKENKENKQTNNKVSKTSNCKQHRKKNSFFKVFKVAGKKCITTVKQQI